MSLFTYGIGCHYSYSIGTIRLTVNVVPCSRFESYEYTNHRNAQLNQHSFCSHCSWFNVNIQYVANDRINCIQFQFSTFFLSLSSSLVVSHTRVSLIFHISLVCSMLLFHSILFTFLSTLFSQPFFCFSVSLCVIRKGIIFSSLLTEDAVKITQIKFCTSFVGLVWPITF